METLYIKIDNDLNSRGNDLEHDIKNISRMLSNNNIDLENVCVEEYAKNLLDKCFYDGFNNTLYFANATRIGLNKDNEPKELRRAWIRPAYDNFFIEQLGGKSLSFRGYIQNGFFVINKIKIVPNYEGPKNEIEEEINGVIVYIRNLENFGSRDLNNKIDETESIVKISQEKFQEWQNYLGWRKKIVEQKLVGIKYEYMGFNEKNQTILLKLMATDTKDFDKIKKYLKRGNLDIFENSYSKDEMKFVYNPTYKVNRDFNGTKILGDLATKIDNITPDFEKNLYVYNIDFKIDKDYIEEYNASVSSEEVNDFFKNKETGFLATKEVGDFALISRLNRGINKALQDESMAPNLLLWLFDITKAEVPADEEINKELVWKNTNLNEEQKVAVQKMLATKDVCLVQGPPGTGKTTVIAEAIYHFTKNGQRVLLASQTNLAVDNVLERLAKDPSIRAVRLNDSKTSDDIEHLKESKALGYYLGTIQNKIQENYIDKWDNDEKIKNDIDKDARDILNYYKRLENLLKSIEDIKRDLLMDRQKVEDINLQIKQDEDKNNTTTHFRNEINKFLGFLQYKDSNFILPNDLIKEIVAIITPLLNIMNNSIKLDTLRIATQRDENDASKAIKEIYNNLRKIKELKSKLDLADTSQPNAQNIDIINRLNEIKDELHEIEDEEDFHRLKKEQKELEKKINNNTFMLKETEKGFFYTSDLQEIKNIVTKYWSQILELDNKFNTEVCSISSSFLINLYIIDTKNLKEEMKIINGKISANKENYSRGLDTIKQTKQNIADIKKKYNICDELSQEESIEKIEQLRNELVATINDYAPIRENFENILKNFNYKLKNIDLNNENEYYKDTYVNSCNVVGMSCTDNPKILEDRGLDTFDVVIIDEVSKATPPELLLPILKSSKVILVGDHRQLPPLFGENEKTYSEMVDNIEDGEDDELKNIITEENFNEYKNMVTSSIFKKYFETAHPNIKHSLLEQFRMHRQIMGVINRFYENRLKAGLSVDIENISKAHDITIKGENGFRFIEPQKHVYWINSGEIVVDNKKEKISELHEARSTSTYNLVELYMTIELLNKLEKFYADKKFDHKVSVGVVCLYQLQVNKIRLFLKKKGISFKYIGVDINTVDRFQGKEKEIIISNLIRTRSYSSHIKSFERINVMFSRAQKTLFIMGDMNCFKKLNVEIPKMDQIGSLNRRVYEDIINTLIEANMCFDSNILLGNELAKEIYLEYKKLDTKGKDNEKRNS
jgi:AAA ATPase